MTVNDTLKVLIAYVENTSASFLEKNGLKNSFSKVKQNAEQALKTKGPLEYINAMMNGTIDEVVDQTQKSNNDVYDELVELYQQKESSAS